LRGGALTSQIWGRGKRKRGVVREKKEKGWTKPEVKGKKGISTTTQNRKIALRKRVPKGGEKRGWGKKGNGLRDCGSRGLSLGGRECVKKEEKVNDQENLGIGCHCEQNQTNVSKGKIITVGERNGTQEKSPRTDLKEHN